MQSITASYRPLYSIAFSSRSPYAAAHKACDAAVEQVRSIWAAMARQEGWLARQQGYPAPMLRSYHQLMGVQARIAAVQTTTTRTTHPHPADNKDHS